MYIGVAQSNRIVDRNRQSIKQFGGVTVGVNGSPDDRREG